MTKRLNIKTVKVTDAHRAKARSLRGLGCSMEPSGQLLEDLAAKVALDEHMASQPKRSFIERVIERIGLESARERFPEHFAQGEVV